MLAPPAVLLQPLFAAAGFDPFSTLVTWVLGAALVVIFLIEVVLGLRYIPNNRVGIREKFWSRKGSVPEGQIIALNGEAGLQVDVLRGGLHFQLWRFQYSIHKVPLVTIPQGKMGYV